jgi:Flp pilus assembly protein TadD
VFTVGVGRERLKQGDRAGAIEKFREAIQLAPDNYDAHYALGLALAERGDYAAAQRAFDEARRLAPWLSPPAAAGRSASPAGKLRASVPRQR